MKDSSVSPSIIYVPLDFVPNSAHINVDFRSKEYLYAKFNPENITNRLTDRVAIKFII